MICVKIFSYSLVKEAVRCCLRAQALTRVQLFVTPWTVAHQAPLSMGFSRQENQSRLPFASPGDLPGPGIEPKSSALQADSLPTELQREAHIVRKLAP